VASADRVAKAAADALQPGARMLVGLSGGLDSTVLLHALARLPVVRSGEARLAAVHVNYRLRGDASDADAAHARALCRRLGVPLAVRTVTSPAPRAGVQAWARRVRYAYFARLAERYGFDRVATAHHRGDQAETVLLNLLRGVGPGSFGGMRSARPLSTQSAALLVRPLLRLPRADLEAYAQLHGLQWREDASNASATYARTHVRALIHTFDADGPIVRAAQQLAALSSDLLQPAADELWARAWKGDTLALVPLKSAVPSVRQAVLARALGVLGVRVTADRVGRVEALLAARTGARFEAGEAAIWRERDGLRFVASVPPVPASTRLRSGDVVLWAGGVFELSEVHVRAEAPVQTADAVWVHPDDLLGWTVRVWQPGDRIRKLNGRSRKISDALGDARVRASDRSWWPVVVDAEGAVVWVPGGVRRAHTAPGADERVVRVAWQLV
jgi:tRNA(Ile)-lysidine synthase